MSELTPEDADYAARVALENVEKLLMGQETKLVVPLTKLNQHVTRLVQTNANVITKMQDRILREAAKRLTKQDDGMDVVVTRVLTGLNDWQDNTRNLLDLLATKSSLKGAGEQLEAALEANATEAGQLAYQGTLVLSLRGIEPWLERIEYQLTRIADALTGVPSKAPFDTEEERTQFPDYGIHSDLHEPPETAIAWPE